MRRRGEGASLAASERYIAIRRAEFFMPLHNHFNRTAQPPTTPQGLNYRYAYLPFDAARWLAFVILIRCGACRTFKLGAGQFPDCSQQNPLMPQDNKSRTICDVSQASTGVQLRCVRCMGCIMHGDLNPDPVMLLCPLSRCLCPAGFKVQAPQGA